MVLYLQYFHQHKCIFLSYLIVYDCTSHHFSVIFSMMCTFSYGHLFLVSIFYQLTSEKDQVYTSYLTHCRQTLQLIKFYLIKNMKYNIGNQLPQFKFPFLSIVIFFLSYGKVCRFPHFIVFYSFVWLLS